MASPVWERASCIDDMATKAGALIDNAELYPSPDKFQEIRLLLRLIVHEAAEIMAATRYVPMPKYLISFDPAEMDKPQQDERISE